MTSNQKKKRTDVLVSHTSEIKEGQSKKILLKNGKDTSEGFIVCYRGKFFGYFNRCRHVSLPLDWGDNDFFTTDHKYLMCKNHGALYLPDTGECVAGPCSGQFLVRIPIRLEKDKIFAIP